MSFSQLESGLVDVFFSLIFLVLLFEIDVLAAPVVDEFQAVTYLTQFGYMQSSVEEIKTNKRILKETLSKSLKQYQDFNNLKVTGNLDLQTMIKMQESRCGFPDFSENSRRRRFVHFDFRWARQKITYSIDNDHKNEYHLPSQVENHEIHRAFKVWEEFIPLRFQLTDRFESDILISFEIRQHGNCKTAFDGPYGALAHAIGPPNRYSNRKPFIHFDDEEYWHVDDEKYSLSGSMNSPNLFQIAAHEIGHVLGLKHSNDPRAIMRAHYSGNFDPNFKLSLDDVYAIQTLYPTERKLIKPNDELLHATVPSKSNEKSSE